MFDRSRSESAMSEVRIKMTKKRDGSVVSRFERPDGTATWQRKDPRHATFFAIHDLEHYAVETVLGFRRGFYGLVGEGWDLSDFGSPWPRGPLPADAEPAELIVGLLDAERATGTRATATEFNDRAALYYSEHGLTNPPVLDDDTLEQIRDVTAQLIRRWSATAPEETLELTFAVEQRSQGALMSSTVDRVTDPAPAGLGAQPITGDHWTLELKEGWTLVPGERKGDYALKPKE